MKKKFLLTFLMVVVFVCIFALGVSATTYNYYENEVAEENKLYTIEASFSLKNTRFELISSITGKGFAQTDANGNALTWYVYSDDLGSGVRNIVVKSTTTIDGVVGTTDENGNYIYGTDTDGVSFSKKVVSVNFFGTNVKTLPEQAYMATYSLHTPGQKYQYCQIADGSYLLALYLPKTLTKIPKQLCFRSPVIVLEFEDNEVIYENFGEGITGFDANYPSEMAYAFSFCANLKRLVIPEGIKTIEPYTFRECVSLSYVKFPSTMTRLEHNVFFHAIGFETVIFGENMQYIGYLNADYKKVYSEWGITNFKIKYMYVPNTINTAGSSFDTYRGSDKTYLAVDRSVVFMFAGTLEEARIVAGYSADRHFKSAVNGFTSAKGSTTPGEAPVSYEDYIKNRAYYDNLKTDRHLLVYNVPKCVAFHDGQHDMAPTNTYKDALTSFKVGEACVNCGEGALVEYAPALEFLGYSAQINGDLICMGYKVNNKTLEACPNLSYGIVAAGVGANADMSAYEPLNPDMTPGVEDAVIAQPVDKKYNSFNFIIKSFSANEANYTKPLVMCAYVTDGEKVDYLCHNELNEIVQCEYATAITFKFIAEECRPKYSVTFSCDEAMGTIEGETNQTVAQGDTSSAVTAKAKDGYTFAAWSNGVKTATIEVTPAEKTDLVAYFTPASTGLPVMIINTDGGIDVTTKEYYINCEITVLDTETGKSIGGQVAEIKGRGNSTWDLAKKPYKFKFENKQDLFGFGKEKTWVLLADHRDYSLLRNMLALNAGLTMSELGYTSKGQSVELYVNGDYRGVYYLCEQIQIKDNRVNITQEDDKIYQAPADLGYLVEMDGWAIENANSATPNITKDGDIYVTVGDSLKSNRAYVIKDPEDILFDENDKLKMEYLNYIQGYLKDCIAAAQGKDYAAVCELIDVKSFAQCYIIFELFKNPDTNYSSVYFYKDKGGKLVCGPLWDFDMAIGNVSHKGNGAFSNTETLWTAAQNPWFKGLLAFPEFRALVGEELLANEQAIRESIAADIQYARAHADAYKKNFEEWKVMGKLVWSNPTELINITTWEEHLVYIENYLDESMDFLIETYCNAN